jgi:hypothetical protein
MEAEGSAAAVAAYARAADDAEGDKLSSPDRIVPGNICLTGTARGASVFPKGGSGESTW